MATAQEEVNLGRLFLLSPLVPFHNSDVKAKQNDFSLMSTVLRNHFPFGLGPYNSHLSRVLITTKKYAAWKTGMLNNCLSSAVALWEMDVMPNPLF